MTSVDIKRVSGKTAAWRSLRLTASVALIAGPVTPGFAQDLPAGAAVAAGAVSISTPSGTSLIVNQTSRNAVVNWQSFSVGADKNVVFNNGDGATLNRVVGNARSRIDGTLTATGSVYLVNPAGVAVGPAGKVSTGGSFVASTHDVADEAFMKGGDLTFAGTSTAEVVNAGAVGSLGGDVALIARKVKNTGTIDAPNGTAALAAGYEVLVKDGALDGGKFHVKVGGADAEAETSGTIRAAAAEIRANGGNVYALAGNTGGVVAATGTATRGGKVFLTAGDDGAVEVGGVVSATKPADGGGVRGGDVRVSGGRATLSGAVNAKGDGKSKAATGGTAVVTGKTTTLTETARIDVGGSSGGVALIGGDFQGGENPAKKKLAERVAVALTTTAAAGAFITADGTDGDGGSVVVWADERTDYMGEIRARGGGATGKGGDAEVSGKAHLAFRGKVDLTAESGKTGDLLLDPYNVVISNGLADGMSGGTATQNDSIINVHDVQLLVESANLTISTGASGGQAGDITIGSRLYWSTSTTLTLSAAGSIKINAPIVATGDAAGLALEYGAGKDYYVNAPVTLSGASATLMIGETGALNNYTLLRSMTDVVNVNNDRSGRYALAYDIDASGNSYSSPVVVNFFSGVFAGLGNSIGNLNVSGNGPSTGLFEYIGFFGMPALVRDLKLSGGTAVGAGDVGMLAGNLYGTVRNVRATGAVISTNPVSSAAGGLIGYVSSLGVVGDSSAAGDVSGTFRAGGLIGANDGAVDNSFASGNVFGGAAGVGGLIGTSTGTVSNSYAVGSATGLGGNVGGLIGGSGGVVSGSYATGAVWGVGANVGGLIGSATAAVNTSYALGSVVGMGSDVGGLIGKTTAAVEKVYAAGAVTGGGENVGGLIGNASSSVDKAYALGSVRGGNYVGGLIGKGVGAAVSQTYASGAVSGDQNVGGLVGSGGAGSVSASFWDKETTGRTTSSGGGAGLTTAEARQASSYADWDFDADWYQLYDIRPLGRWEAAAAVDGVVAVNNLHQLQLAGANLSGSYKLGSHIDATPTEGTDPSGVWATTGFAPVGYIINVVNSFADFTGAFDGNGKVVSFLNVNRPDGDYMGMFGSVGPAGVIRNLSLSGGSVTGKDYVGALAAAAAGSISNVSVETIVSGGSYVGGVIGSLYGGGSLTNAYFGGSATGTMFVGGIAGSSAASVSYVSSTGAVSGASVAGGLIGLNDGTIEQAWSSGAVSGTNAVGGAIGDVGGSSVANDVYWDVDTSGQGASAGGNDVVGLTTTQARAAASYSAFDFSQKWYQAGDLRPIGRWELTAPSNAPYVDYWKAAGDLQGPAGRWSWSNAGHGFIYISNMRQLQLMRASPASVYFGTNPMKGMYTYVLDRDLNAAATTGVNAAGIWSSKGFLPISNNLNGQNEVFYGVFDGAGHTIEGLNVNRPSEQGIGLFGFAATGTPMYIGAIMNLNLSGGVFVGSSDVGSAAGYSKFIVYNVHSSADVTSSGGNAGGLIGRQESATANNAYGTNLSAYIAGSSASGQVQSTANAVSITGMGGLVGISKTSISDSYATGNVSSSGAFTNIGGLVGRQTGGQISRSYASGSVNSPGGQYAGGLIGYNDGSTVSRVYASGNVSGGRSVGGLIGENNAASVSYAYALGSASGSSGWVGGLIGHTSGAGTFSYVYASGAVTAPGYDSSHTNGPLLGMYGSGTSTNLVTTGYWDSGTSGVDPETPDENILNDVNDLQGTALTTAQMRDKSNYVDWDFDNEWFQTGDMRPIGRWEAAKGTAGNGAALIVNAHQLALVETNLSGAYRLGANIDASATAGAAASGIWSDAGFIPVGGGSSAFSGVLYGDGKTISNLTVNRAATNNVGLFAATTDGALIGNLTVGGAATTGASGAGALVGDNRGTLVGVSSGGTVSSTTYAGGLAGKNAGYVFTSSSTAAVVAATSDAGGLFGDMMGGTVFDSSALGAVKSELRAGGLVGALQGAATKLNRVHAQGAVSGSSVGGSASIGGLVGANVGATIEESYATGDVSEEQAATGSAFGGLIGANSGTVRNSYATGSVGSAANAGGLIGVNTSGTISNVYASGSVSGDQMLGGLIGAMSAGSLSDAFASGPVVSGAGGKLGGLIGSMDGGSVLRSYATGPASAAAGAFVGGLIGVVAGSGTTVTQTYATGAASGASAVGGLVGSNAGSISESYAAGAVTATSDKGGLVGLNDGGVVASSYWDTETSGAATSAGGSGLTTAGMKTWSNFTGWSGETWSPPDSTYYPQLYGVSGVVGVDQSMTYGDDPADAVTSQRVGAAWWNGVAGTPLISGLTATTNAGVSVGSVTGLTGTFKTGAATRFVGTATVARAALTVTTDGAMTYGSAEPTYTTTISGWKNSHTDSLLTGLSRSVTATATSDAGGSYTATSSGGTLGGAAAGNYEISYVAGTTTVSPATLTVTAGGASTVYGEGVAAGAGYSVDGWKNGHTDSLLGGVTISSAATATSDVGEYAATASGGVLSGAAVGNYTLSYVDGALRIDPATLTVAASSGAMVYGDAAPVAGYSISGWKNGHTDALLTGVSVSGGASSSSSVGAYATTASGGALSGAAVGNYIVAYVGGAVTVSQRGLTVAADGKSRVYGDENPTLTYVVGGRGLANGDVLTGALATTATTASGVGSYAINQGSLAASGNYALTFNAGSLDVTARQVTVTADDKTRVYGDANPTLTYVAAAGQGSGRGLVNGDVLTGDLAATATTASGVGSYAINQGSLGSPNYAVTFNAGALTVTARPITATAENQTRVYGDENPTLTYIVGGRGLVNGDVLTGALATTATTVSGVGSYAIGRGALAASSNYQMVFTDGALTVTARPITATADDKTRVVGAANPALTYVVGGRGLVNGDVLTGDPTTAAVAASPAGSYAIERGGLAASANYVLSYVAGSLTVRDGGTAAAPTPTAAVPLAVVPPAAASAAPAAAVANDTSAMFTTIGVGKGTQSFVVAAPGATTTPSSVSSSQQTSSQQTGTGDSASSSETATPGGPAANTGTVGGEGEAGCVGGASAGAACVTQPHPENVRAGRFLSFIR